MKLSEDQVHKIFLDCLFSSSEPKENFVRGNGVVLHIGFNPERLKSNEAEIIEMLDQLPDDFKNDKGGGMSFLNLCNDRDGDQWASVHRSMDELITLGNAIGKVEFPFPREVWYTLPGGLPYVVIK
jgi:hypothetical protein